MDDMDPADQPSRRSSDDELWKSTTLAREPADGRDPDELPPVEPPSARFLVQLFVIPMLIVGAIVGVYVLFGRMAAGEQDWRELVAELRNNNEHRRWRAALGLAQLLKADQERETGSLTENPEIAKALVDLFEERVGAGSSEENVKQQVFLARALGMLDQPGRVVPALTTAMLNRSLDRDVRKTAVSSVAVVAGRAAERPTLRQDLLAVPEVVESLVELTQESDPLYRQLGAFTLGLFPTPQSAQRLEVLLGDPDHDTQVNAAVALARQHRTSGWPVFQDVLRRGMSAAQVAAEERGPALLALQNTIKAVAALADEWSPEQRTQLLTLIAPVAQNHPEPRIRTDANAAVLALHGAEQ
jgi:hypothetical protein